MINAGETKVMLCGTGLDRVQVSGHVLILFILLVVVFYRCTSAMAANSGYTRNAAGFVTTNTKS